MDNHQHGVKLRYITSNSVTSRSSNVLSSHSIVDSYILSEPPVPSMISAPMASYSSSSSTYETVPVPKKNNQLGLNGLQSGTTHIGFEGSSGTTIAAPSQSKSREMSVQSATGTSVATTRWALVEWETANEEPNAYTVIESSQIMEVARDANRMVDESGQRNRDSGLYTGKLIHVLRGRYVMPATIVIISDDKDFIDTELQQLRMMAANNLISKSNTNLHPFPRQPQTQLQSGMMHSQARTHAKKQFSDQHENTNGLKRQRTDSGSGSLASCGRSSSVAFQEISDEEDCGIPVKMEASRKPITPPPRTMTARFDRTVPSSAKAAPPMTFDQQTQTIGAAMEPSSATHETHFVKIMSCLESIMAEQTSARMEYEYNRKLVHELHEILHEQQQLITSVWSALKTDQEQEAKKVSEVDFKGRIANELLDMEGTESDHMVGANDDSNMLIGVYETSNGGRTCTDNSNGSSEQWGTVQRLHRVGDIQQELNSNHSWSSTINTHVDEHIVRSNDTPLPLVDSSNTSSKCSTFATMDEASCTYVKESLQNSSSNTSTIGVEEMIKNDWNDSLPEDEKKNAVTTGTNEMVTIGANNTTVLKKNLDLIKWSDYKAATRKLLLQVFSREELASRSLSGRPSPAFVINAGKPIKDRLNPDVVADVIEIVRNRCNVNASMVRAVITTKCADENKMLRQRMGILPKRKITAQTEAAIVKNGSEMNNKENIC